MPGEVIQFLPEVIPPGLPSTIQDPTLRSLLQALKREVMTELNCHQVGRVISFDVNTQKAKVEIQMQRVVYNQTQTAEGKLQYVPAVITYPVLGDVPVFVLSGGTGVMTFPIVAGDDCLVLFNDRDLDLWYVGGQISPPNSGRLHSLSDGLAIIGFRRALNPVSNYSSTDVEMRNLGGKIAIAEKIGISNDSTSLREALDAVITALTALNAKTGPSAATQIAAAQTLISNLLKT